MKKKGIIISIIVILILIIAGTLGFLVWKNLGEEEDKKEEVDTSLEGIYTTYIKDFDIKGTYQYNGIGIAFIDLNGDSKPEMLAGEGNFNLYSQNDEIKVFEVKDNAVKELTYLNKNRLLCLVYDIQNNKFVYGIQNTEDLEGSKVVREVEVIENLDQEFTKYNASDKSYMKKYITVPGSETIKSKVSVDVFYGNEGKSEIKNVIKERTKTYYTLENAKTDNTVDIENLKTENEKKLNTQDNVMAETIGKELLEYTQKIYQNCKLSEKKEPVGGEFGQELLNYEEAFEAKFTKSFIENYWYTEGLHYWLKDVDGKKYLITPGIGNNNAYIGEEMVLKENTENKITFVMTGYFLENLDDIPNLPQITTNFKDELERSNIKYTTKDVNFVVVKDGDTWKVDEYTNLSV